MSGYYALNPHYAADDFSEAVAALEKAKDEAAGYFARATKTQLQTYTDRIVYLSAYKDSPYWVRERDAAKKLYAETTKEARELMDRTVNCILMTGEVSEELDKAWTTLQSPASVTLVPSNKVREDVAS